MGFISSPKLCMENKKYGGGGGKKIEKKNQKECISGLFYARVSGFTVECPS